MIAYGPTSEFSLESTSVVVATGVDSAELTTGVDSAWLTTGADSIVGTTAFPLLRLPFASGTPTEVFGVSALSAGVWMAVDA